MINPAQPEHNVSSHNNDPAATFATDSGSDVRHTLVSFVRRFSTIALILGALTLLFGIVVLVWPNETLKVVGYFFGIWLIVVGIGDFFVAVSPHHSLIGRIGYIIASGLLIIFGVISLFNTYYSLSLLATFIGIAWVIRGLATLSRPQQLYGYRNHAWDVFWAIVSIVAGVILFFSPLAQIVTLQFITYFAGFTLIVLGILEIVSGIRARAVSKKT